MNNAPLVKEPFSGAFFHVTAGQCEFQHAVLLYLPEAAKLGSGEVTAVSTPAKVVSVRAAKARIAPSAIERNAAISTRYSSGNKNVMVWAGIQKTGIVPAT